MKRECRSTSSETSEVSSVDKVVLAEADELTAKESASSRSKLHQSTNLLIGIEHQDLGVLDVHDGLELLEGTGIVIDQEVTESRKTIKILPKKKD